MPISGLISRAALALMVFCSAFRFGAAEALTLRGNLRDDMPNVDPSSFNGPIGHRLLSLVYEGLTRFDDDGRIHPALAESWETPDGGLTWRFRLRSGVRFHTGKPLEADDVRLSFEAVLRAKRPSFSAEFLQKMVGRDEFTAGSADRLAGVVATGPLTVEMRFTEPQIVFPTFPFFIFDAAAVTAGAKPGLASAGTGPFKLAEWRRGREVRLEANADFRTAPPAADEVRLIVPPSADRALAMFEAGELDFLQVGEGAFPLIAAEPARRARLQVAERRQARFLAMNTELYPPFADVRVRAAVSLAIDRGPVIDRIFSGLARLAPGYAVTTLAPLPAGSDDPALALVHRHDPAEARRLLAEAGYPDGRGLPPLELTVIEGSRDEGVYYADQLTRTLGMPVGVRPLERAAMIAAANTGSLPFFLAGWTADFPEPLTYLASLWHGASRYNQARWRDPEYDRLIDAARVEPDAQARRALYVRAERRLAETAAVAAVPTPFNALLRGDAAQDVSIDAFGMLHFKTKAESAR